VAHAEGGGKLEAGHVMELGEEEGGPLPLRNPVESPRQVARQAELHREVLRGRGGAAMLAGPRHEPNDLPAPDLVERDAMGDLVEPGPRVLGLLERVVVAVGLDERILGEVGRELSVADHPQEIGVDLAVVTAEELLDEPAGGGLVPAAHDLAPSEDADRAGEIQCHPCPC